MNSDNNINSIICRIKWNELIMTIKYNYYTIC